MLFVLLQFPLVRRNDPQYNYVMLVTNLPPEAEISDVNHLSYRFRVFAVASTLKW